jgi:hypothetical protein
MQKRRSDEKTEKRDIATGCISPGNEIPDTKGYDIISTLVGSYHGLEAQLAQARPVGLSCSHPSRFIIIVYDNKSLTPTVL